MVSLGDTGNGFLSAIAIVQALYHRDRTGEGQFVDTSIMYAQLLERVDRLEPRRRQPARRPPAARRHAARLARLRTACTRPPTAGSASPPSTDEHRAALGDARWASTRSPTAPRSTRSSRRSAPGRAAQWFAALDAAGVPCEVSTPDFVLGLFDDPEMIEKGWVTKYRHPIVGEMDVIGLLFDLSETPGVVQGPPLVPGQDTRRILRDLG